MSGALAAAARQLAERRWFVSRELRAADRGAMALVRAPTKVESPPENPTGFRPLSALSNQRARFSPPGGGKGGGMLPARGRGGGAAEPGAPPPPLRRDAIGGGSGEGDGG
ncbi:MAG: hypothetical protein ABUL62_12065, partial [Myxococcales bacterium]